MKTKEDILSEMLFIDIDIKEVKQNFHNYITNQSISLDERWDVFSKAHSYLSEHYSYVQDIFFISEEEVVELAELRDFYARETIDVCDLFESYKEELLKLDVNIELSKENILKANLKSFDFDH